MTLVQQRPGLGDSEGGDMEKRGRCSLTYPLRRFRQPPQLGPRLSLRMKKVTWG